MSFFLVDHVWKPILPISCPLLQLGRDSPVHPNAAVFTDKKKVIFFKIYMGLQNDFSDLWTLEFL
jgi:hypothetical protein